jgi:malonyl-CoA/methylmalonyl-CoA synthetase
MHTHASLQSQVEVLVDYWKWQENDKILNVLPVHHIHGLINVLNCGLWAGAQIEA